MVILFLVFNKEVLQSLLQENQAVLLQLQMLLLNILEIGLEELMEFGPVWQFILMENMEFQKVLFIHIQLFAKMENGKSFKD